ncbi:UDP-glucose 4-epimerase GalE [Microbacterium maritypicum]|uniref:UDP-glucose 4-epimerase GalE n=1 Tax=Microbacterium TaxID=33882 RepID=UPI0006FDB404|nr:MULTISPECIES: UDP-glucose 4-epimerase GalE [Microbacterium]AZS47673.1 UDP-glucose 4-epimerase [Microbacterium oxydans]KQV04283.1 UDP-glucose 4-epimerase [Microbacterium sp. Root322]KQY76688.1 UDP-glucose 4-epimerase [Microbacterium sp. Root1433D1]WKT89203.1 UDP-glucose 4-epimerase GalE [Microbacterium liquefaciens]
MRVLVTGGAGYIGSHTLVALLERGHEVFVIDSFANSSPRALERVEQITGRAPAYFDLDLRDDAGVDEVFSSVSPDAVIHFAGLKAVGESVAEPLRYYAHNLDSTFSLLRAMSTHGVRRLVFSSSATVYGDTRDSPYEEDGGPLDATNPYGQTKVMLERILTDVAQADPSWSIALLRYFNPIGAHESGLIGEDPNGIPNNLAPYISQVAVGRLPHVNVFGADYQTADGTGERDYIHVVDLAEGHVAALEKLNGSQGVRAWNLGTGRATSVLALIKAFEAATGTEIPYRIADRREGDLAQAWADTRRAAEELGWTASRDVETMAVDAWRWQSRNPRGYAD